MAYTKNTWVDQNVERPKTYEVTNNQDGSITLTDSFGLVTDLGTPVNAVNMNHIEDGIDGCAIRKHNLTETFNLGEWVLGGTGDDEGIYKSLIPNNVGNALTDGDAWEKVKMGGGATRNIGEIVASTLPLTDAGLHLLDGALIDGYGIYSAFVDYIASIYDASASYFCTEAEWQQAITDYGVCGKFVYDSVNNTVRLPKYNSKIYTGGGTAPVIGNGQSLGLTNGTEFNGIVSTNANGLVNRLYAYNVSNGTTVTDTTGFSENSRALGVTTDPTKSGIIAQLSNITTSLDGYYYIIIATSTKTDIQVDIDEVTTDLNGKADTDLTNCTDVANIKMAHNAMPSNTYTDLTLGASGTEYTAPADGYVMFRKNNNINGYAFFAMYVNDWLYSTQQDTTVKDVDLGNILPVKKGDKFSVYYNLGGVTRQFRFIYAVGSESEAS